MYHINIVILPFPIESTAAMVPQQLAKHASAQAAVGSRDDKGNIIGQRRDAIKFAKK